MYWRSLDTAILQVPKCGSTTIRAAMEAVHGKGQLPGHHPASEHWECFTPERVIAFVRDPLERFVSQVNFNFAPHCEKTDLVKALDLCFKQQHTHIMRRQVSYIDGACELHRFEDMDKVLQSFGCAPGAHENKGRKTWTLQNFYEAGFAEQIHEYVYPDEKLRQRVA